MKRQHLQHLRDRPYSGRAYDTGTCSSSASSWCPESILRFRLSQYRIHMNFIGDTCQIITTGVAVMPRWQGPAGSFDFQCNDELDDCMTTCGIRLTAHTWRSQNVGTRRSRCCRFCVKRHGSICKKMARQHR